MSLVRKLAPHLPFSPPLCARVTGSQAHGDAFVRATLEAIVAYAHRFPARRGRRSASHRTFHAIWSSANIEEEPGHGNTDGVEENCAGAARPHHFALAEALLLTAMRWLHARGHATI
jgi:hypothetical protein